jgi:hypothetical protein
MAKTSVVKKQQKPRTPDFDFSEILRMDSSPDDEVVLGMMTGLIEAYRHQQQTAVELTRLVLEKNASESMSEEEVFSTFKRASQTVSEVSPIKELFEKMNG